LSDHQEPGSLPPEPPIDAVEEAFGGRSHRRRQRKRRKMPGENISYLNLTPMMDIMTMLLVFLVKSFEAAPENININASLRPPESTTQVSMRPATKVTITKDALLVDDVPVLSMGSVRTTENEQASIPALREALIERADHLKAVERRGGSPFDGRLMVVADETTPYSVVTSVLVTAGESKFSEYKLVVMQKAQQ
jgi:biopolymer transport protein ExbD